MDEIALLLIESTAVSLTCSLLSELTAKKIRVIFCDEKRNPTAELSPYYGCHDSPRKIKKQILWSEQNKGSVWTAIIAEKIGNQARLLERMQKEKEAALLQRYLTELEFGDATNREGHAAKVYFNALFGMDFGRRVPDDPINAALNYGYGLILSAVNREVVSNGYLTQLGLFHDNTFNQFNLSSDLMEPFRPLIDARVVQEQPEAFNTDVKHKMIALLHTSVRISNSEQTVLNAIKLYVKSVFDALNAEDVSRIQFPVLLIIGLCVFWFSLTCRQKRRLIKEHIGSFEKRW